MPASRSARATTLAPRSCPSRPGLATTTLIGCVCVMDGLRSWLEDVRRPVLAPDTAKHGAHHAGAGATAPGLLDQRHHVGLERRRLALDRLERGGHAPLLARALDLAQARELPVAHAGVGSEDLDPAGRAIVVDEVVDPDDDALAF